MGETDLRIIAVEPTSLDITSTVTDDNEHVNGSQELTEEEIEQFIKMSRLQHLKATMHQSTASTPTTIDGI